MASAITRIQADALRAEAIQGVAEAAPEELTDFQRDYLALEEQFFRDTEPLFNERGVSPLPIRRGSPIAGAYAIVQRWRRDFGPH